IALLDHSGITITDVFGYSLGGGVALHAAVRHPERFSRLAVHAAHVQWTDEEAADMIAAVEGALGDPERPWARRLRAVYGDRWAESVARMRDFTAALP